MKIPDEPIGFMVGDAIAVLKSEYDALKVFAASETARADALEKDAELKESDPMHITNLEKFAAAIRAMKNDPQR